MSARGWVRVAGVAILGVIVAGNASSQPTLPTGVYADTLFVPALLNVPADSLFLGEPFDTRVTFHAREPVARLLPLTTDDDVAPLEFVDIERLLDADGTVIQRVRLRAFAVGTIVVPPLAFAGITDSNVLVIAETPADSVVVRSIVPADADGLADLHPPVGIPGVEGWRRWWPALVGAAALLALAAWWWRRRRGALAPVAPDLPAHEAARQRLDALSRDPRSRSGPWKPFYTDLTDVLRLYVRRRFGVAAPDLTTAETIRALRTLDLDDDTVDGLQRVLGDADGIKFAKLAPPPEAVSRHLELALAFVDETVPPPVVEEEVA